eukprot:403341746
MLRAFTKRMTKELTHSSIVVNKIQTHNRMELLKLSDALFYLIEAGSNFISIHDIKSKQSEMIKIEYKPVNSSEMRDIQIVFINEDQNMENLLKVTLELGQEKRQTNLDKKSKLKKSNSNSQLIIQNSEKDVKKQKYIELEQYMHDNLECYQYIKEEKNISKNPQIILVFNSRQEILEFQGYPMFQKEIAEIFECGRLQNFRVIDFIRIIERYSAIEQRWGL